jgi:hypothetical protein
MMGLAKPRFEAQTMKCGKCGALISAGLVCLCLVQDAKAPPKNVVGQITATIVTSAGSSTAAVQVVNTTDGQAYRLPRPAVKPPASDKPT